MSAKLADWQTYEDYPSWSHAVKFADFSYTLIAGIAGLIGFLEDIFRQRFSWAMSAAYSEEKT